MKHDLATYCLKASNEVAKEQKKYEKSQKKQKIATLMNEFLTDENNRYRQTIEDAVKQGKNSAEIHTYDDDVVIALGKLGFHVKPDYKGSSSYTIYFKRPPYLLYRLSTAAVLAWYGFVIYKAWTGVAYVPYAMMMTVILIALVAIHSVQRYG